MSSETKHIVNDQTLLLLPNKALIWEERNMLILADLHLGKITHFRKRGIPLPKDGERENFERFSYLILNHEIKTVLILGDLFHSDYNSEWVAFKEFLNHFSEIDFILVMGNHDILEASNYQIKNLTVYEENLVIPPFNFTHHPVQSELYNICGHIHPCVRMEGQGLQRLRIACFYFSDNQAILPAFGAFTGTHAIEPKEEDDIYAITENSVLKVF